MHVWAELIVLPESCTCAWAGGRAEQHGGRSASEKQPTTAQEKTKSFHQRADKCCMWELKPERNRALGEAGENLKHARFHSAKLAWKHPAELLRRTSGCADLIAPATVLSGPCLLSSCSWTPSLWNKSATPACVEGQGTERKKTPERGIQLVLMATCALLPVAVKAVPN